MLHVPSLTGLVLERHLTTPADLARASPNAGPGDHAAGDNSLVQAFTQRPIAAHAGGYRTVVPSAWLIGAATWPRRRCQRRLRSRGRAGIDRRHHRGEGAPLSERLGGDGVRAA